VDIISAEGGGIVVISHEQRPIQPKSKGWRLP
jgi:hypothetical protein